jgi:ATP-dependent protease ClpP protease subunit
MKNILLILFALVSTATPCFADTFKHKNQDIVYHGYATGQMKDSMNIVVTQEKGQIEINLVEYEVRPDSKGRNSFISLLCISGEIALEHETAAFEEAIDEEAAKGPLLILIEIDTPGGRVDLAERICAAIIEIKHCQTIAFISGGEHGGAFSAGAAVSLACDKIFMAPATSIGAATMIAIGEGEVTDMKGKYGEVVGEKFNSAWRTFLASLAEKNNRSGALAKAMVDKDIVVLEVERRGEALYIEPKEKLSADTLVRTVCSKGELLTLTTGNAVRCQIADGVADSKQALLVELGHGSVPVKENQGLIDAKEEFEKVVLKFNKLNERRDLKFKELRAKAEHGSLTRNQALRDYEDLIKNGKYLLNLKRSYPDIPYEEHDILSFINSVKAEYASIKAIR